MPLQITRGNSLNLNFIVKQDGVKMTKSQLDAATDINFQAKVNQTDDDVDAIISKTLADGISTLPDGAATDFESRPNLRVALTRTDTLVDPAFYFFGVEIIFSATSGQEPRTIYDGDKIQRFEIIQDTLRS